MVWPDCLASKVLAMCTHPEVYATYCFLKIEANIKTLDKTNRYHQ